MTLCSPVIQEAQERPTTSHGPSDTRPVPPPGGQWPERWESCNDFQDFQHSFLADSSSDSSDGMDVISCLVKSYIYLFERIWPKCSGDFESIRLVNTRHWRMADKVKLQDQVRAVKE